MRARNELVIVATQTYWRGNENFSNRASWNGAKFVIQQIHSDVVHDLTYQTLLVDEAGHDRDAAKDRYPVHAIPEVKEEILKGIARGDIWLAKIRYDQRGKRIFANVCLEVFIKSRGTCLLEHINVSGCTVDELPSAFTAGMAELCSLHALTGVEKTGEYLSQKDDRQVGLGMLGLANLLALEGVSYAEFGEALTAHNYPEGDYIVTPAARKIVKALQSGIDIASNELIATLPRGVLTFYKSDKGKQLSADEYKMICINTKIITQRAIMGCLL